MTKYLWLMLIPSLLFAASPEPQQADGTSKLQRLMDSAEQSEPTRDPTEKTLILPRFQNMRLDPLFVDVEADQITIYPEKTVVTAGDLTVEGNAFESFLDGVEKVKDTQYIVLILRPGSAVFQRRLRQMIRDRGIDVGFEPWDAGQELLIPEPNRAGTASPWNPEAELEPVIPTRTYIVTDSPENQSIVVRPVSEKSIEVEVRADSFTILPDQTVVTRDELQIPGNAFDLLLDQMETKGDCPRICLREEPGGKPLRILLGTLIQERGERMGCRMAVTNPITVLVATPKEFLDDSKPSVFFECRNQQLFPISLERLKQACDTKTVELRKEVDGDENGFLKRAATTVLELDGYRIDYTYALLGKYVLTTVPNAEGHPLEEHLNESDETWLESQLSGLNPKTQSLCIFVRPDSLNLFEEARAVAQARNFTVTSEQLEENAPIMLGPGGDRISY